MIRFAVLLLLLLASTPAFAVDRAAVDAAFRTWLAETAWPAAAAAGVRAETFQAATADLSPDWDLPDLQPPGSEAKTPTGAFQAEFTGPSKYLADKKLNDLAAAARRQAKRWAATLSKVEARTGVPAGIVLGIWGKESGFGSADIPHSALRTIATQAFMGSRREIFLPELVAALLILQEEPIGAAEMRSSWAGAMGQPQFLPTKFRANAVDFDGDGRRDIWTSVPDTLGSIGHYLQAHGWIAGRPWGVEVTVPMEVSCTLEGPDQGMPVERWAALGVARTDGRPVSEADVGPTGHLLMPAGRLGPAFLVSENFYVLKRYNESDLYALLVGIVGDRVSGRGRIEGAWKPLGSFTRGAVRDLQRALEKMGHDVGGTDGLVGFRTRVAIGRWQESRGEAPTCFPGKAVFAAFR
jgi:lytic murein transglycosylase